MEIKDGNMSTDDFAHSAKAEKIMQQDLARAFAEVYQILWHADEEVWLHVPYAFRNFLYDYMDKSWTGELDFSITLNEMNLLRQTRVLLSLMYRDFLCTAEEREDLIEKDREAMKAQKRMFKHESLIDLLPSGYYIPKDYSFTKYYSEEISKSESECLVRFLSKLSQYNQKGSRTYLPAELIVRSLIMISRSHAREIRKERGDGWRCGIYKNTVYDDLSRAISAKYSDSQIITFIDFCNDCCDCHIFLYEADIKIKAMMVDFLSMRPAPIIYPINIENIGDGRRRSTAPPEE